MTIVEEGALEEEEVVLDGDLDMCDEVRIVFKVLEDLSELVDDFRIEVEVVLIELFGTDFVLVLSVEALLLVLLLVTVEHKEF